MSKTSAITVILLIFCVCILLGCTKGLEEAPSPTPIPSTPFPTSTHTLTPTITVTPQPKFTFSRITLLPNELDGLSVLGLIQNQMDNPASNIEIQVAVYADETVLADQEELILPIQHLQSGEAFPFSLQFTDVTQADHIEIEVIDFQMSMETDIELEVELTGTGKTEENKYTILGWISNNHSMSAQIHYFSLLTTNSEGTAQSLSIPEFHASSLLPSQKVPFMAILEQDPSTLSVVPFLDATEHPEMDVVPFSFPQRVDLTQDSQGNLLLRGAIRNDDSRSRWVSCIVALRYQNQLISLTRLNPPTPLSVGENRAFGLSQFPSWKTQFFEIGVEIEGVDAEFYCDSLTSSEYKGQILTLTSEITGFESTGSSLIIRGEVFNITSHTLSNPAVQADLRSIDGSIQASNWILLQETIEPGGSSFFVIPIPLPEGTILSELEIDVRAIALLRESDLQF